jgi:hypothetical protein
MTGDQFAVAVEALIVQGRAAGLTDEAMIIILQEIIAALADGQT